MGLASTFTNSIVREIGRNYGKSISNNLLGDSHSTPVRMVRGGQTDITRKRGRIYENKLDEYLQKFSIKGAIATFNQGQNIFNAYFELAEEAQSDGSIDLTELVYLVQKYRDTLSGLKKVQQALIELGDEKKAAVIEEKQKDLYEFLQALDEALKTEAMVRHSVMGKQTLIGFLLMFFSLDAVFLFPKRWQSYVYVGYFFLGLYLGNSRSEDVGGTLGFAMAFYSVYWILLNPIFKAGVWRYIGELKRKNKLVDLSLQMKGIMKELLEVG